MRTLFSSIAIPIFVLATYPAQAAPADDASTPEFFETHVRPVLASSCYGCHTNSPMGNLRVDNAESLTKGGSRGPAIVPGDPDKSVLLQAIRQTGSLKMPLAAPKLKDSDIANIAATDSRRR